MSVRNPEAVAAGCANLVRHIRNVKKFGVPVVVAINRFVTDTDAELDVVSRAVAEYGVEAVTCTHWADGGAGTEALANKVVKLVESESAQFAPLYDLNQKLWQKVKIIATELYGADDIIADKKVRTQFEKFEADGFGHLPVCIAKTQYSFSTDPNLRGAASHHGRYPEIRLSAGAEFVVVVCGDIMTMPGLPRVPAANSIGINEAGQIDGLF
ncbi:MAG: formate--tetrahydrofolate ligase [Thiolinea sp.]